MELAQREGPIDTIYKNAENVHHHEIEESCIEILEFLHNKFMKMNVSIDDIESGIVKHWELCNTSLFMKDINDLDTVRFEDIDSLKQKYYDKFIETYNFIQMLYLQNKFIYDTKNYNFICYFLFFKLQ